MAGHAFSIMPIRYEQLRAQIEGQLRTGIDPYGTENPAEFSAASS